ncbi:aldehyde dehydrogenase family protein [Flindersiella endophytica]
MNADGTHADELVVACGAAAKRASGSLAGVPDQTVDAALMAMASMLEASRTTVLAANAEDVAAAEASGMSGALLDRLKLSDERIADMAAQLRILAQTPHPQLSKVVEERPDGLRLLERRRPVGVIGANFEARPNVTLDVASQLVKSRNAGVLRTGSAALRSAQALVEHVIAPALDSTGLPAAAIQLVPGADRETAFALVRQPSLIPLVILRGSGETTRVLGEEGARHGVRTLAHADGGGVLYVHAGADLAKARELVTSSLDRLGVCNRLNLLLIDSALYDSTVTDFVALVKELGIEASLPPHDHPRGYEWALDSDRAATVTIDRAEGPADAARIANEDTSGLAAAIATEDAEAAQEFMDAYTGTGVFWNATTRLLDGFKLLRLPETGINIDRVPGPRGPVTFQDLYLRQYVVVPA